MWFHPELRCAVIESKDGLTMGSVKQGDFVIGQCVEGDLESGGPVTLTVVPCGMQVRFHTEGHALSEDQVNEVLGLLKD